MKALDELSEKLDKTTRLLKEGNLEAAYISAKYLKYAAKKLENEINHEIIEKIEKAKNDSAYFGRNTENVHRTKHL